MRQLPACTALFVFSILSGQSDGSEPGCLSIEPVTIVIRNDDVSARSSPGWERRLLNLFKERDIPQSAGFVPQITSHETSGPEARYFDIGEASEIVELYAQSIHEGLVDPVQHGLTHRAVHPGQPPSVSSEFSGLDPATQEEMLKKGKDILEKNLRHPIDLFIPPWNNLDGDTLDALRKLDYVGVSARRVYLTDENKTSVSSKLIDFNQLYQQLDRWEEKGRCLGQLEPEIVVVLYHSWSAYSGEGLQRVAAYLDAIKESGVEVRTLSEVVKARNSEAW